MKKTKKRKEIKGRKKIIIIILHTSIHGRVNAPVVKCAGVSKVSKICQIYD